MSKGVNKHDVDKHDVDKHDVNKHDVNKGGRSYHRGSRESNLGKASRARGVFRGKAKRRRGMQQSLRRTSST